MEIRKRRRCCSLRIYVIVFLSIITLLEDFWAESVSAHSYISYSRPHVSQMDNHRLGAWRTSRSKGQQDVVGMWGVAEGAMANSGKIGTTFNVVASTSRSRVAVTGQILARRLQLQESRVTGSRQEVKALLNFKSAISRDPTGTLKSWRANDSAACTWAGVVCSSNRRHHVVALDFRNRQLVGNINSALLALGHLRYLQRLDLSGNKFAGSISGATIANYTRLLHLNASFNQMSGAIPLRIGQLLNLETLDFNTNNLTGGIPSSLGNCTSLRVLDLGNNRLQGNIPPVLGRLAALEFLSLGATLADIQNLVPPGNSFSGTIPPSLGNCSSLQDLILNNNENLGGELPVELSKLKSLKQLQVMVCRFTGVFPVWISNLTSLETVNLAQNLFSGEIPATIGQLRVLNYLNLSTNNFTGPIPIEVTNCTSLSVLELTENSLSGDIPDQLGQLRNLESLSMTGNLFTGIIPASIGNCSSLSTFQMGRFLDANGVFLTASMDPQLFPSWIVSLASLEDLELYSMNLYGKLPEEIGRLSKLNTFILGPNNVTGTIPTSLANCTLITDIESYDNPLTGKIPSELGILPNLSVLAITGGFLSGTFPSSIANLTQVQYLIFAYNSMSGTIDADLARLSSLAFFLMQFNQFDGPIPKTLSNCSSLQNLNLRENHFEGEIPTSFGNLTHLERLYMSQNKLGGTIPPELRTLSKLSILHLEQNNLQGEIFPDIGHLYSLQYLSLSRNELGNNVPKSLGNCSGLISLDLSYNQFRGDVPGEILSGLHVLTALNLSHNMFSGPWPPQLVQLESMQEMDLSANDISGPMILDDKSWADLTSFDVSLNNLSGLLSESLGLLPMLTFFNVSYNNFEGSIPDALVVKSNLTEASFLGNPDLCGVVLGPGRDCSSSHATFKSSCKDFKCKRIWISTVACLTGLLVILALAGVLWKLVPQPVSKASTSKLIFYDSTVRFSAADLSRIITDGDSVIGRGANSVVFKGSVIGDKSFAIKTLSGYVESGTTDSEKNQWKDQWDKEIFQEIHILSQLRHINVLKVLGFYSTSDLKAIVLEYMPEGSLDRHLYPDEGGGCKLPWEARFQIAAGIADGMKYLHHDVSEPLVHRDLKPRNILLDKNLHPKVADFGLSRFTSSYQAGKASVSTVCGTPGYMPPEYALGTNVSTKGDVFSYGMVLLELITGRSPIAANFSGPVPEDYRGRILKLVEEDPLQILDATLRKECMTDSTKEDQMLLMMRVALFCTREESKMRPSMIELLQMLGEMKEIGSMPGKSFERSNIIEDILSSGDVRSSSYARAYLKN